MLEFRQRVLCFADRLLSFPYLTAASLIPISGYAASEVEGPGVPLLSLLQTFLALILVVGLMFATAWLARKFAADRRFGNEAIKIVGGIALGPRERVMLLEIGDEWLVIGVIPGQIRTLHRLPKGDIPSIQSPVSGNKSFSDWLQGIARKHADD